MNKISIFLLLLLVASGCREGAPNAAPHSHADEGHGHHHEPPHGGTGVELGDHAFNLEFLAEAGEGKIRAWVLGAHMENFVRIEASSFEVVARLAGREEMLIFQAQANAATGETVGDSSEFLAEADWLKDSAVFEGHLKSITVQGNLYENVTFTYP